MRRCLQSLCTRHFHTDGCLHTVSFDQPKLFPPTSVLDMELNVKGFMINVPLVQCVINNSCSID